MNKGTLAPGNPTSEPGLLGDSEAHLVGREKVRQKHNPLAETPADQHGAQVTGEWLGSEYAANAKTRALRA
jgi:hypothetical protein